MDIVLRHPHDLLLPCPNLTLLREALRESDVPILIDVHDWALIPDAFRATIKRHYVVLVGEAGDSG